ncbi:MAG: TPM domain-containing protein [Pseudomonadota bacterium]
MVSKIAQEIASVEKVTSGEIVPVVARKSSNYRTAELVAAIIFGYIFVFIAYEFKHDSGIIYFLFYNFLGILLSLFLTRFNAVKRFIVSRKVKEHKVHLSALSAFHRYNVHRTKHKTGILIYVSLMERMVVVLGDEGINSKVDESVWKNAVSIIVKGIKEGNVEQGIVNGIGSCRELLRIHFPLAPGDVNELPNEVIYE